jgi:hypothetical protein
MLHFITKAIAGLLGLILMDFLHNEAQHQVIHYNEIFKQNQIFSSELSFLLFNKFIYI